MDSLKALYPKLREVLQKSIPKYWPELRTVLAGLLEGPMIPEAVFPLASCQAVNGKPEDAVYVSSALVALGVSLRILDELEDQDRPGQLWEKVGSARAWNYASAIHILPFEILSKAPLDYQIIQRISQYCVNAFLRITAGQDRDLAGVTKTIEDYWLTVEMKSSCFVATACATGAIVGTENLELIQACGLFGHHLGLALQIFNDMESIWHPEGKTDLEQGKVTLPLLYGLSFDHPRRDELLSLVTTNQINTHTERIKEILTEIDTKSFLIWAALQEREQALEAISICPNTEGREVLESYVTGLFGDIDLLLT